MNEKAVLDTPGAGTQRESKTHYMETEGGKIAYEVAGSGPLVVCVPSMGDIRQEYRFLTPQLVAAGYKVAAMDVRGHGESSTEWNDFSVAGVGRDILALIRHLGGGPAVVIGDSMAAGAAVYAAAETPEDVAALVLMGPFVRDVPGPAWMRVAIKALFARPWGSVTWLRYYLSLYPARKPADFRSYAAKLGANLQEPGRLSALQHMLAASKAASEERLDRVKAPVLVLMGTRDPDFKDPRAEADLVAGRLHARLQMVEGAGHYPHAEMPEQVGPVITRFLSEVMETRGAAAR